MKIVTAYAFLIFGLGINYVFNITVARWLGPEDFGRYSYAWSVFTIFSLIAVMSFDEAAVRFIPQSINKKSIGAAIQHLALLFSLLCTIIYYTVINFFLPNNVVAISYIFALCLPLFVMIVVISAILQSYYMVGNRMALRYAVEPITKISFLIFFCMLAEKHVFDVSYSPGFALFVALLITNLVAFIFYRKYLMVFFPVSKKHYMLILNFVLPLFIYNVLNVVSGRLDVVILGIMVTASHLGQYSAAFQTSAMLSIVLQGIETIYAPMFSKSIGKNNLLQLASDYQQALRWTMFIASPCVLIFVVYPELALFPFGKEYSQGVPLLLILCLGQFLNLASGSANAILLAMGKTREILINALIYLLIAGIFISMFTLIFGVTGAAFGVVLAVAIPNFLRVWFVYKITGCHPFSRYYWKTFMAMLISLGVAWLSKSVIGYSGLILYPSLFLFLVFRFGLHPQDKQLLSSVILCRT